MAEPFMPWPGTDGIQTETIHAWWFDGKPMPVMSETPGETMRSAFDRLEPILRSYPDPAQRMFFYVAQRYGFPDEASETRILWKPRQGWAGAMVVPASSME